MRSFHTNCTLPADGPGFVSSPNARGTLDILWSCFSILILSTWSILHPNVPTQSTPHGKIQGLVRKASRFFVKLKWMIVNVLAPEWALGKAWSDHQSVSTLEAQFKHFSRADGVPWSSAHSYLANMGGFAIKFGEEEYRTDPVVSPVSNDPTEISNNQNFENPCETSSRQNHTANIDGTDGYGMTGVVPVDSIVTALSENLAQIPNISSDRNPQSDNPQLDSDFARRSPKVGDEGLLRWFDQENCKSGGGELPAYIRRVLGNYRRGGILSASWLEQSMDKSSRYIGKIDWKPIDTNIHAVVEALDIVSMKHFKTAWEEHRFRKTYPCWFHNLRVLQGSPWILDACQILVAREQGILETLPNMSIDEVDDRNKGDAIVKLLAVIQVTWFFSQMGVRLYYQIPMSQLEILVFSYTICTALTYGCLWNKPKDVSTSVTIKAARYPTAEEMIQIAIAGPVTFAGFRQGIWIPNNAIHRQPKGIYGAYMLQGCMVALIIFGSVHCVAWGFFFPTSIEQLLWRICSLATMAALPPAIMLGWIISIIWRLVTKQRGSPMELQVILSMANVFQMCVFVLCRLFILFEVFRSLFALPGEAFKTTWSEWPRYH